MSDAKYTRPNGEVPPLTPFEQAQLNNMHAATLRVGLQTLLTLALYITMLVYIIKIYNVVKDQADRQEAFIEAVETLKTK